MATDLYSPSPSEQWQWGVQRRNAVQGLGRSLAQTNFARGNYNANRAADTQSLASRFLKMRNRLPQQYTARGLWNSGIAGQGYQDFNEQQTQAYGDLNRKYQQMLGQLDINDVNAQQQYGNEMADVVSQEALRRQEIAAQLRALG